MRFAGDLGRHDAKVRPRPQQVGSGQPSAFERRGQPEHVLGEQHGLPMPVQRAFACPDVDLARPVNEQRGPSTGSLAPRVEAEFVQQGQGFANLWHGTRRQINVLARRLGVAQPGHHAERYQIRLGPQLFGYRGD